MRQLSPTLISLVTHTARRFSRQVAGLFKRHSVAEREHDFATVPVGPPLSPYGIAGSMHYCRVHQLPNRVTIESMHHPRVQYSTSGGVVRCVDAIR